MAMRVFLPLLTLGLVRSNESPVCGKDGSCMQSKLSGDQSLLQRVTASAQLGRQEQSNSWLSSIKQVSGLKYGTYGAQVADIYWPDAKVPAGGWLTVMAIHGVGGTEKSFQTFCQMIAKTGRQCISIDYASMGKSFDGMVESSSMAIDWFLSPSRAKTYNIDTKKGIVVFGQSRGGFITGDLLWNSVYDQSRLAGGIISNGVWKDHYDHIETAKKASLVPFLALSASDDKIVQKKFAEQAVADLVSKGADVTHVIYKRATHNLRTGSGSLYEHVSKFLSKFETTSPPAVGSVDVWPQVCKTKCKCNDPASAESKVASQAACQDKADKVGHRYIQYLASKKTCVTSKTCDDADVRTSVVTEDWKVFWRPRAHGSAPAPSSPPSPPAPAPTPSTQEPACQDNEAPMADWGLSTCVKQQKAGKCDKDHHKGPDGYCRKTCGHCQPACQDNEAPMADWGLSTCVKQQKAGKCNKNHHKGPDGYCRKTCGHCH